LICIARQRSTRLNAPLDGPHERGIVDFLSFCPHLEVLQLVQVGNRFRASHADDKDVAVERRKGLQGFAERLLFQSSKLASMSFCQSRSCGGGSSALAHRLGELGDLLSLQRLSFFDRRARLSEYLGSRIKGINRRNQSTRQSQPHRSALSGRVIQRHDASPFEMSFGRTCGKDGLRFESSLLD
jgi:hypothetical protein